MSEHEFEIGGVADTPLDSGGERLQESVVGDVAASISAVAATGGFGYAAASFHTRRQRDVDEAARVAEMAALRAEVDAEMRVLRAELRLLRGQGFGFGFDDGFSGFGVEDDDFDGGFGVE